MLFSGLSVAILTLGHAHAVPTSSRSTYAVKERHIKPTAWTNTGPAPALEKIHLQIGLRQQNKGAIEQHLLEISDPSHHRYGQHMSSEEVDAVIAPSTESVDLVSSWLEEHGIADATFTSAKDWVHVVIPIEKAEELLQTKYETFVHHDGATISRATEWSLPLHLHEHIDVVQPTTSFFHPKREATTFGPKLGAPVSESWWQTWGNPHYGAGVSRSNFLNVRLVLANRFHHRLRALPHPTLGRSATRVSRKQAHWDSGIC